MALSQTLAGRSAVAGAISSQQSAAAGVPAKQVLAAKLPLNLSSGRHVSNARCFAPKVVTHLQSRQGETAQTVRATADTASQASTAQEENWVPVLPITALPRGARRLVRQDGELILLLWYKSEICAIESRSPAEGAYSEGFSNAKLTQEGGIVCPGTDTVYDLKTGEIKEWYPKNPVLRFLTSPTRNLITYPVKVDGENILIDLQREAGGGYTEVLYNSQTGDMAAGQRDVQVNVVEPQMQVDETQGGFGFTPRNEILNGRAAQVGFVLLLVQELVTGKGFLGSLGILEQIYKLTPK
ncbi:hypothetical protein KFL_001100180 [Klebsormidium nitens]|uniref:Rieske domain-containing protein n=1 Tax=Klebsormidium nitens TaxID=105231 RepID=A0A1Y1HUV8_KLENI|nr:hypothetical protein KFL_001100180 [Klebsormidium nitens]|eukprot:GAQ82404.1 hypothetical protein KFL_001100180 [Klebsormidium nitens]